MLVGNGDAELMPLRAGCVCAGKVLIQCLELNGTDYQYAAFTGTRFCMLQVAAQGPQMVRGPNRGYVVCQNGGTPVYYEYSLQC